MRNRGKKEMPIDECDIIDDTTNFGPIDEHFSF